MTEYDLFVQHIPMIAEMAVIAARMDDADYLTWKTETLDAAPPVAKSFIGKTLIVIDKYREERKAGVEV